MYVVAIYVTTGRITLLGLGILHSDYQGQGSPWLFSAFCYFPLLKIIQTLVTYAISSSYMTGVTPAKLWSHLLNINVIEIFKS